MRVDEQLITSGQFHDLWNQRFRDHQGDCYRYHGRFPVPTHLWDGTHDAEPFYDNGDKHSRPYEPIPVDNAIIDRNRITDPEHPVYKWFQERTGLKTLRVVSNLQRPGMVITWHADPGLTFLTRTEETKELDVTQDDLRHFFYFHSDRQDGQFFQLGSSLMDWRAGDMVEMPWWMPHASANTSKSDRIVTSVVGLDV